MAKKSRSPDHYSNIYQEGNDPLSLIIAHRRNNPTSSSCNSCGHYQSDHYLFDFQQNVSISQEKHLFITGFAYSVMFCKPQNKIVCSCQNFVLRSLFLAL